MERVFMNNIKKQLTKRIIGEIYVHIIDDTLIVDINPLGYVPWHFIIKNIAVQLSTGLTSRIVSDVIVKQYKKYILSVYFNKK